MTRLYTHNPTHGWSYDVAFEGVGDCWCFERELTDFAPVPGIRIQRGAVVPPGAILPPTDVEIKRMIIEDRELPEPFDPPDEPQAAPAIRITKPVPMPTDGAPLDAVQTAIRETKAQHLITPVSEVPNGRTIRIEQAYVGELTGSISGQVFCYGYAVHEGVCGEARARGNKKRRECISRRFP